MCSYGKFHSVDYAVPDSRVRAYGVCLNWQISGISKEKAKEKTDSALRMVRSLKVQAPLPVADVLLDPTEPYLTQQLEKIKAGKESGREKDLKHTIWPKEVASVCRQTKIRLSSVATPPCLVGNETFAALPLREQRGLSLQMTLHPGATSVDVYSSIYRMTHGKDGILSTFLPGSKVVLMPPLVDTPRLLTGLEAMSHMGFPRKLLMDYAAKCETDADVLFADMAGNAFAGTPITTATTKTTATTTPSTTKEAQQKQQQQQRQQPHRQRR